MDAALAGAAAGASLAAGFGAGAAEGAAGMERFLSWDQELDEDGVM